MKEVLLEFENVHVHVQHKGVWRTIIHDISLTIRKGEKIAILGPSGVGKTTLLESVGQINNWSSQYEYTGKIMFQNKPVLDLTNAELSQLRGDKISFIFQEPQASFDPLLPCGVQVVDVVIQHGKKTKQEAKKLVLEKFIECNIPDPAKTFYAYPHQLSGGQLQRIMCIMATINGPDLLLADEPTSSLDELNSDIVLNLIESTHLQHNTAIIMVTHDWSLAKNWADRIIVMNEGTIADHGSIHELENNPMDPFTKALLAFDSNRSNLGKNQSNADLKTNVDLSHVLEINNISKSYPAITSGGAKKEIFSQVHLSLLSGKTLGVVGPSGCGKSTLARCILRLEDVDQGQIFWQGKNVTGLDFNDLKSLRSYVQIVFQDTNLSLPPHYSVQKILKEALRQNTTNTNTVSELLDSVGLSSNLVTRLPFELSGGQRQRVCIARALAVSPKVIVFDEVLSMLDPISQLQIVKLLLEIQKAKNIGYVFITHDKNWLEVFTDDILTLAQK